MIRRFITLLPLLTPFVAFAQSQPQRCADGLYRLIVPVGSLGADCLTLREYMNGVFTTAIGLAGVLAVIMIVICGIKLMGSGSVSGKSEAKQCIWNAIFGVLLAIGSWLLLNTINPLLLRNDAQIQIQSATTATGAAPRVVVDAIPRVPGWYYRYIDANGSTRNSPHHSGSYTCLQFQQAAITRGVTITDACFEISPPIPGTPPPPPAPAGTIPPPAGSSSELATRNRICGNNSCVGSTPVGINKNSCVGGNTSCTNVAGLDDRTISHIVNLASACNCNVVITGGTEPGHASHGPNIPVFDLSMTTALRTYIRANATVQRNPSFCISNGGTCFSKWLYDGYWYTDETGGGQTSHWHVCRDGTTAPPGKSVQLFINACTQR